jgi:hypothetical protein
VGLFGGIDPSAEIQLTPVMGDLIGDSSLFRFTFKNVLNGKDRFKGAPQVCLAWFGAPSRNQERNGVN